MDYKLKTIILLLTLRCELSVQLRTCDDCKLINSCAGAAEARSTNAYTYVNKMRNAFCGYFPGTSQPMICCSDFGQPSETGTQNVPVPSRPKFSSTTSPTVVERLSPNKIGSSTSYNIKSNTIETDKENIDQHSNLRLLPEKCGKTNEKRIVGGSVAGLYEFPWIVLIAYRKGSGKGFSYKCSGTLINERYVLTAAHCIKGKSVAGVRAGDYNLKTEEDCVGVAPQRACESLIQDRRLENITVHEGYVGLGEAKGHDIALLRLFRPITMNDMIKNAATICLPVTRELQNRDVSHQESTVAGWGVNDNRRLSKVLRKVSFNVYSAAECREHSNIKDVVEDYMTVLCAGEVGKDSCYGDSGSPLMIESNYPSGSSTKRYVQYGIVSHGPSECGIGQPGIYTDVSKYMKWILDNIYE